MNDSVDYVGDFVADDELDILGWRDDYFGSKFVAHKEAVFDFDGAERKLSCWLVFRVIHK